MESNYDFVCIVHHNNKILNADTMEMLSHGSEFNFVQSVEMKVH